MNANARIVGIAADVAADQSLASVQVEVPAWHIPPVDVLALAPPVDLIVGAVRMDDVWVFSSGGVVVHRCNPEHPLEDSDDV
jgi:hypothetical protein